jgi:hypothetical protein
MSIALKYGKPKIAGTSREHGLDSRELGMQIADFIKNLNGGDARVANSYRRMDGSADQRAHSVHSTLSSPSLYGTESFSANPPRSGWTFGLFFNIERF